MELRHLRYFVAVAEELHFGRTAHRLHISQPPLSHQIRKLEEELGLKLFLRSRRGVELTQGGRVFLAEARQILAQIERSVQAVKRADRGQIGPLVVACGPLAIETVLPTVLRVFRARFPEVEISLKESTAQKILEALDKKTADVGLLMPYVESETLQGEVCLTVPIMAALPKSHPLAKRQRIRLKQLANEPFVLPSHSLAPGFYEHAVGMCRRAGFTPKVVQEAAQHPTLLLLVAAGYGVSLIPSLQKARDPDGVAFVKVQEPWAAMQLWMAWRHSNSSAALAAFIDVVRAYCLKKTKEFGQPRKPAEGGRAAPAVSDDK